MRLRQLTEYGRIVKGVNTTVDVGPNEIPIQAKKWGFKVDKDGRPPTLSKKVKGKSTNVLYNLGILISTQSGVKQNAIPNSKKLAKIIGLTLLNKVSLLL